MWKTWRTIRQSVMHQTRLGPLNDSISARLRLGNEKNDS